MALVRFLAQALRLTAMSSHRQEDDDARHHGEVDVRKELLDGFLTPGHGATKALGLLHRQALVRDPLFYGHLAGWYRAKGSIRDHHELFVSHLMTSRFPAHRVQAKVLLQFLRPYQVARVVRYTKEHLRYQTRVLRSAVRFYLRRREAVLAWLQECLIRDRRSMKYLYATLRLAPHPLAEAVLFHRMAPRGTRLEAVRELRRREPAAQAELIRSQHIHFSTAMGAVRQFTPDLLSALVSVMTPQQVINNLAFLERRGGLACDRVRQQVERKLQDGIAEARVSDFKALVALARIKPDPDLTLRLFHLAQERIRNRGKITVPTAIFVDKSGSMEVCIETGKMLAVLVTTICQAPLYVEAFDGSSFTVNPRQRDLLGWEGAFGYVVASGRTSIGAPLSKLERRGQRVEQIVIISDGQENTHPFLADELVDYRARHKSVPRVIFLKVCDDPCTLLERSLQRHGIEFTVYHFRGDYYNLPNLVPLLCSGAGPELVEQVMAVPLHTAGDLHRLPPGFDEETLEVL